MKKSREHLASLSVAAFLRLFLVAVMAMPVATTHGQPPVALYDEWFHEARCVLRSELRADSTVWWLEVTFDEGNISIPRGSRLVLRLRGGTDITLTSDRDVIPADVVVRRWRDRTDRLITCRYPISEEQLTLLHEHDLRHLRIETTQGWLERRIPRHLRLR